MTFRVLFEKAWAWCVTTSWDGSRGMFELLGNLKFVFISKLYKKFLSVARTD